MATPAELAVLRDRFAALLIGPACRQITFVIGGYRILPGGFTVIGMSLAAASGGTQTGPFNRRPMSVRVFNMPAGVGARYNSQRNELGVPSVDFGLTPGDQMSVVHEAMHAVFDYDRIRLSAYLEEAAAYIAGAMFLRYGGFQPIGSGIFNTAEQFAIDLCGTMLPSGERGTFPWTDTVTPAQEAQIISAIRATPAYHGLSNQAPGWRYRHDSGRL